MGKSGIKRVQYRMTRAQVLGALWSFLPVVLLALVMLRFQIADGITLIGVGLVLVMRNRRTTLFEFSDWGLRVHANGLSWRKYSIPWSKVERASVEEHEGKRLLHILFTCRACELMPMGLLPVCDNVRQVRMLPQHELVDGVDEVAGTINRLAAEPPDARVIVKCPWFDREFVEPAYTKGPAQRAIRA